MSLEERVKYAEMKARHHKIFLPWYKKWWGVLVVIVSGIILVAIISSGIYVYREVKRLQTEKATNALKEQRKAYEDLINGPGGYMIGATNPKITLVEFTDFACPFCKESAPIIRKLMNDPQYKDSVRLVVRDYPIHDTSIDLAIAARCAGEQGKFWDAYDSLFANQDNLKSTTTIQEDILSWGGSMKLDSTKFSACMSERRYLDLVKQDYENGNQLKIQGTPTWFVNYHMITGSYSEEKLKELFDGIIQKYGTN